jgi:hypothetical protein
VHALGGEIESGPLPGAGFRLAVLLPVRPGATPREAPALARGAETSRSERAEAS